MMEDGPRNPGHLLPCEVEVIPLFRGEEVDEFGCVIGVDFMSEEGKKQPRHYVAAELCKLTYRGQMFLDQ